MMGKHLTVIGGHFCTQKHWKTCLDKILSGEFDPNFVISHRLKLSQVPEYHKQFDNKDSGALKCFVRPDNFRGTKINLSPFFIEECGSDNLAFILFSNKFIEKL